MTFNVVVRRVSSNLSFSSLFNFFKLNNPIMRCLSSTTRFCSKEYHFNAPARRYHHMKAVVVDGLYARLDSHRPVPKLRPDCVRVKPVAVALNPTDWKHFRYGRAKDGCIVGCDYAGIVEEVGSAVSKRWRPGDRVFGSGHGGNLLNADDGVFAESAVVVGDLQMKIPDAMSFAQAATLGLGSFTVGQGLYQKALKLEHPDVNPVPKDVHVLISGGATATGALGIQFARQ